MALSDSEYRKKVSDVYARISRAFDTVDPDVVEAEVANGTLTLLCKGSKVIISPQPPVQQIWFAAAALGKAVHFSWDEESKAWKDDKKQNLELFAYTAEIVQKVSGLKVDIV